MRQDGILAKTRARIAGIFYLLVIVLSPLAMYLRTSLTSGNDAAASAARLMQHAPLYRFAVACDILSSACYLVVTALFYAIFKPVSRLAAFIATLFSAIGIAIGTFGGLFNAIPLFVLHDVAKLNSFTKLQLGQLSALSVKIGGQAVNTGIVFFGFYCLCIGWLIFKSTFLPRILGYE